jgi:hypothetical protein
MKSKLLMAAAILLAAVLPAADFDGKKPFRLTTLLGETFENCRILKVTPDGISVAHDVGVSKIPFTNLSDEWKALFHYDPEKAREFREEEERKRAAANAKLREVQREYEKVQTKQMAELALAESKRAALAEKIAKQQAEDLRAASGTAPGGLVPLPGDVSPAVGMSIGAGVPTITPGSPVIIPQTTPLGQPYTPGVTGGQRYIINQGAIFTPGDGSLYYINPYVGGYPYGYGYGYGYGNQPVIVCPPATTTIKPTPHPKSGSTIFKDGKAIHVGP